MGVYLAKPKTDKKSECGGDFSEIAFGLTSMQGWRKNMEDAHLVHAQLDEKNIALFGVFDGHGGPAVARWVGENMLREFQRNFGACEAAAVKWDLTQGVPCDLETTIYKDRSNNGTFIGSDSENSSDHEFGGDDGDEEHEGRIAAGEVSKRVALVCEALQRTYMSMDERLRTDSVRQNLKVLHEQAFNEEVAESSPPVEQDDSTEWQRMLEMYLTGTGQKMVYFGDGDNDDDASDEDEDDRPQEESALTKYASIGPVVEDITDIEVEDDNKDKDAPIVAAEATKADSSTAEAAKPDNSTVNVAAEATKADSSTAEAAKPDNSTVNEPEAEDDSEYDIPNDGAEAKVDADPRQMLPYRPEQCGSTATSLAIVRSEDDVDILVTANAGDSRIVLCRGTEAISLTRDHKPQSKNELRRIENAGGKITMGRVDGNLNLSRCVGDLAYKADTHIPQEAQRITAFPDIRVCELSSEDKFVIIACDGIWDCMTNQKLVDYIILRIRERGADSENGKGLSSEILSTICEEVCDRCLASNPLTSEGIGCDNMTLMIVTLGERLRSGSATAKDSKPRLYTGRHYRLLKNPSAATTATAEAKTATTPVNVA